ncbi:hypothetical protein SprV_0401512800 [Sparganum proliferum]
MLDPLQAMAAMLVCHILSGAERRCRKLSQEGLGQRLYPHPDNSLSPANGMVERFHRQLKASLRAAADPENWKDHLPLVLLSIRSALKPDLDCSAVELVFGATV